MQSQASKQEKIKGSCSDTPCKASLLTSYLTLLLNSEVSAGLTELLQYFFSEFHFPFYRGSSPASDSIPFSCSMAYHGGHRRKPWQSHCWQSQQNPASVCTGVSQPVTDKTSTNCTPFTLLFAHLHTCYLIALESAKVKKNVIVLARLIIDWAVPGPLVH